LHRIEIDKRPVYVTLYNFKDDPGEKRNIRSKHADKVDPMKSQLERWMASVIDSLNGKDYA